MKIERFFGLSVLLSLLLLFSDRGLYAMEMYWPNDEAKTNVAEVAIEGVVEKVRLPASWDGLTIVTLKVTKVLKGDIEKGSRLVVFHEPGAISSDPENSFVEPGNEPKITTRWQCPPFVEFTKGCEYKVWITWHPEKKCFIVPSKQWAVRK